MKILYIDMNVFYHNPTRNNYINLLKHIGKVDIFGIGFSSEEELEKGFSHKLDEYDLLVFTSKSVLGKKQFFNENNSLRNIGIENFFKYYLRYFNLKLVEKYYLKILEDIKNSQIAKVMLWLELDYIYFENKRVDILNDFSNLYFLSYGKEFLTKKHKDADKENHINLTTGDNWKSFIEKNSSKFITFTHFVSESEFFYGNLSNRKYDIVVPGVEYFRRKKAIEVLKKANYSMPSKKYMKLFSLLNKLKFPIYNSFLGLKLYNSIFYNTLINSRFVYTASGAYNGPVRKFFEISASGACMIMDPFNGADKLGFKENENFIYATYENLLEVLDGISLNEAQKIAKYSQELVWQRHSTFARAKMLKEIFYAILSGSFNGTYWENGDIKIDYK